MIASSNLRSSAKKRSCERDPPHRSEEFFTAVQVETIVTGYCKLLPEWDHYATSSVSWRYMDFRVGEEIVHWRMAVRLKLCSENVRSKHHGLVAVEQYAVFDVPADCS